MSVGEITKILESEASPSTWDMSYSLCVAVAEGQEDIVRLLLERGANINTVWRSVEAFGLENFRGGTALTTATGKGQIHIVKLLLEWGADVNTMGGEYGTALAVATHSGEMGIVKLLLAWGAEINKVGGEYGTALAAAAHSRGKYDVKLLLDWGADVNKVGGEYGTALAAAAHSGREESVRLLLDRGADVNTVSGKYGTALAAAAHSGERDIVWLLFDRGADVNIVGGEYGTALAAAAHSGKKRIVRLLLVHRADVNTVGGEYGTPLAAAAHSGKMYIMERLLDWEADVNTVGGEYGTALAAAAHSGREEFVRLLLDQGADVNTVGGEYGTALTAAAYSGGMGIVRLLLDRGADVNTVGGKYGTALTAAAAQGDTRVALLLLDGGADINTLVDEHVNTLLNAAACEGITRIVSLLLDRGTGVDIICGKYGTALAAAASWGRTDTASLLVKRGADIMRVHVNPVRSEISWPPFPMPHTSPYQHSGISSSPSCILSAKFHEGGNLTPEQADVPCLKLTEEVLWNALATTIGLKDTTLAEYWIRYDLCYFVTHHFDFGLAYAAARVAWKQQFWYLSAKCIFGQRREWHRRAQFLDEAQSEVIEIDSNHSSSIQAQQLIVSPYSVMPRRLWDLKSNRVVDFRMLHAAQSTTPTFWAITHSWTSDMTPVETTVNQFQWPVPLPKGISLESLRSELLTFGAEYVWLDVICLRQKGKVELEQLRQQEWKLDVPTIGNIYRAAEKIVRYFNGLGVPFSNDGWDGSRHWLRRAWTLQEIALEKNTINGGIQRNRSQRDRSQRRVFLNSQGKASQNLIKFRSAIRPVIQLAAEVGSPHGCGVYELAREMAKRYATKPVDKLCGLFYLLRTTKLPCYNEQLTSEDIWRQCFHLLPLQRKAEILFDFPYRGSDEQWFPTWAQLLEWPTRDPEYDHIRPQISPDVVRGEISCFISHIWTIPNAIFYETDYQGEYEVEINENLYGFYLPYLLQKPIDVLDSPVFILATLDIGHAHSWVVCRAIEKKAGESVGLNGVAEVNVLKKIGVIRTDSCSELMVGGQNGASLLQQMDCLFV